MTVKSVESYKVISYAIIAANNNELTSYLIDCVESNSDKKSRTKLTFEEESQKEVDRELADQEIIVQKSLALLGSARMSRN